jgi:chromosome segregation ATPase
LSDFRARFDGVDARFAEVDARFDRVDARFAEVDARFDRVDARFDRVETRLDRLDGRMDDLGRHMRVLHESVMDRFAAQKEYSGPTRAEFAELKEMLGRRLEPLEMVVRAHSADIDKLKRARR